MKLCLVSPPTVTEFGREVAESEAVRRLAEHAPVGLLTLAAVLEEVGTLPEIVDLNRLYYDFLREPGAATDFCAYAVDHLLGRDFDVAGFGTLCSSYPLTLRIAQRLRAARPEVPILMGGPQASAVDVATLERFLFVDYVVRFEAEESLPRLLDALEKGGEPDEVPGITWRQGGRGGRGGRIVRTPSAPVIEDLDGLPLPAYHRYPYLRHARSIPLELGRGCPYACTFCSTNDFFRRSFRLKTPRLVVEQMIRLKAEYGIHRFELIHDMFTVDRRKVVQFCEAILESGEELHWGCSARTDRVDDELLDLMAAAGCRGIFYGIETGSAKLQKSIDKGLLLPDAMARIRGASERGIRTAASLITGFPDETEEDFSDTVDFFVRTLRYENAMPQLHVLAPLADTPLHREYLNRLTFDDLFSDMSHQGWEQDPEDRALIAAYREVFPNFYAVPTPLDRKLVKEVRGFLLRGAKAFRYLLVALHQEEGHILGVFREFQLWRDRHGEGTEAVDLPDAPDAWMPYYLRDEFRRDFLRFVEERFVRSGRPATAAAFSALVAYETEFDAVVAEDSAPEAPRPALEVASVPALAANVRLVDVSVDYRKLLDVLIEGGSLDEVPQVRQRLASRQLPGCRPEVLQLSPLSAAVLALCDGRRTVAEVGQEMARLPFDLHGIPAGQACRVGLARLQRDGLIEDLAAAH
jgi:radical SAM superfamily enzyme YgiQ (UPF0313 family)